jgi:PDZ domain-containing secreted protein
MVTVKKTDDSDETGIELVQYKSEIYVGSIKKGPFFATAIDKGDKILKLNGKQVPKQVKSVEEAEAIMASKDKITIFAMRPDPERDLGYKWVMENQ